MAQPTRYAYSTMVIKAINDEEGIIEGFASTPTPDRVGDVVEPQGAEFSLPLPLLMEHNRHMPIGKVLEAKVTDAGIKIKAKIEKDLLPEIERAWKLIKAGIVRGLSIGFRSIEDAEIKGTWGVRFIKWEWLELSAVTIPANMEASIEVVKSLDQAITSGAASGAFARSKTVFLSRPGVSGATQSQPKGQAMKQTVSDQIKAMEAERAAKTARMSTIMEKSSDEGRTLDEAETEEYDTFSNEVKAIDQHLVRLRAHEKLVQATAQPASDKGEGTGQQGQSRSPILFSRSNKEKGQGFVRMCMAMAHAKGSESDALLYVKNRFPDMPELELAIKAAVAAGTTSDANWAAPLVNYTDMAAEFIDLLRPATIIGRMQGLRRVPFNIRMSKKASGSTVGWVGQGAPKPVSALDFDTVTLTWAKVAGIVVLTEELVRFSSPSAEAVVRQDLIDAFTQFTDQQFIDPTVAAVPNVSPASITNGISAVTSTGGTVAQITADINALMNSFATANQNPLNAVWVMKPRTAQYLATLRTSQDIYAFPGITMAGGVFMGLPVLVSNSVPFDTGTSTYIVLVDPTDIFLSDDGAVRIDASNQASLQMDSAPAAGAQSLVSLWQNNMIGLRAERFINYQRRRDSAVAVLQDVAY